MQLIFQEKHLSISQFNRVELPDFTVLTGVNGSWKSHLLQAIEQKKAIIEDLENANITQFNYETFRLENEWAFSAQQLYSERDSAWQFFIQGGGNIKHHIQIWKQALGEGYTTLKDICAETQTGLFDLVKSQVNNDSLFERLKTYKNSIKSYFRDNEQLKNSEQAHSILALIKKMPFSLDEIEREDFLEVYKPFFFKHDFLPQQLWKIIWDYHTKLQTNEFHSYQNERYGKNYPVHTEESFIDMYGPRPWDVINEILNSFTGLEYKVKSPEGSDYYGNFQLKLIHNRDDSVEIWFENLSSGERILMALVASIYKTSSDNHFPDILLLDEIDASLHPSMMKNLLDVVERVFLAKGVKVILVTHSPSTIALAPEESIFVVNKSGENRIEKRSKEEALSILTDWFVSNTMEQGTQVLSYKLSQATKPAIFTEGPTDKIMLVIAWNKLYPNNEMPFDIIDSTGGAKFLRNYVAVDLYQQSGNRKALALFDFDHEGYPQWVGIKDGFTQTSLVKTSSDWKIFAMPLLVPTHLKSYVYNTVDAIHKSEDLRLEMEHLFIAADWNTEAFKALCPNMYDARGVFNIGKKLSLVEYQQTIESFSEEIFVNFTPLFTKINALLS